MLWDHFVVLKKISKYNVCTSSSYFIALDRVYWFPNTRKENIREFVYLLKILFAIASQFLLLFISFSPLPGYTFIKPILTLLIIDRIYWNLISDSSLLLSPLNYCSLCCFLHYICLQYLHSQTTFSLLPFFYMLIKQIKKPYTKS